LEGRGPFTLDLMFVPGGGTRGAGEYSRSLVLAAAARERWPEARIAFLTSEDHPHFEHDVFERHTIPGKVSRNVAAVNAVLRATMPRVAIFDNRGQTQQIAFAHRLGIRTLYIATQPQFLRRAFRVRRLRHLDQLWIAQRRFGRAEPALRWSERVRLALAGGPAVHFVDSVFPEPPENSDDLRAKLGLASEPYALFVPGGGGYESGGRPVSEIFAEAAQRVHAAQAIRCVLVMGPLYTRPAPELPGVTVVGALPPKEMIGLISEARITACGGGGISGQVLGQGCICVAAPTGGPDQPERIRLLAEQGLLEPSGLDAQEIAERTVALLSDAPRCRAMRARIDACGFRSGLPAALGHLARLADG
jgi:hypothetical protein